MTSKVDKEYVRREAGQRLAQGDILRDFIYQVASVSEGKVKSSEFTFPYVVLLSQDCDLEWDFKNRTEPKDNQDKYLHYILLCPAYLAEQLKSGIHLNDLELTMKIIGRDKWGDVKTNQNQRYHFLKNDKEYQIPDLAVDFKHYFTVPRDLLYQQAEGQYIGSLRELFRESLSQRFAYYLSRIGLPGFYGDEGEKPTGTSVDPSSLCAHD